MARVKLGELLVQAGIIDELQLRSALAEQRKWGRPLGRTLIEMRLINEQTLVSALSRQLNVAAVDLDTVEPEPGALKLLPHDFCLENGCVPFRHTPKGNFLDVAMADPTNQGVFDRVRISTRCNVRPYLAGPFAIERTVRKYYLGQSMEMPESARDNRPWLQSRPGEQTFDMDRSSSRDGTTSSPSILPVEVRVTPAGPPFLRPIPTPAVPQGGLDSVPSIPFAPVLAEEIRRLAEEVAALHDETARLNSLLERDEKVIRRMMALLVEKGFVSKQELMARINKD